MYTNIKNIDKAKMRDLYDKYSQHLYYYALGFVKQADQAEEILQDSFMKLWENRSKVENHYTFLKNTIRNLSLNHVRDLQNRREIEKNYIEKYALIDFGEEELEELAEKINSAIKTLPPQCQRILILKCVEGLSYNEIAEDMDISVNTVKSHIKAGYKKMRDEVDSPLVMLVLLSMFQDF